MLTLPIIVALITLTGPAGSGMGGGSGAGPASTPGPGPTQGPEWWREARPQLSEYDRAYRSGYADGMRDARDGREVDFDRQVRRGGGDGRRGGGEFRRGYTDGYRAGFRSLAAEVRGPRRPGDNGRERGGGYRDPAVARGLSEGFRRGFDDGRDRDRYDPVRHKDYRRGDDGYFAGYGPKEAYRDSYREGFRQGYETGYRDGAKAARH